MEERILRSFKKYYKGESFTFDIGKVDFETIDMVWQLLAKRATETIIKLLEKDELTIEAQVEILSFYADILQTLSCIRKEVEPLDKEISKRAEKAIRELMDNIKIDEYLEKKKDDDR